MATPTLLGHPQRATPRFEGLASRGDRSRVAGGASAEGGFEPRVWRGRRGNAMSDSTACLQRSFKGKGHRAQRQTHRLESRRAEERNSSGSWGFANRGRGPAPKCQNLARLCGDRFVPPPGDKRSDSVHFEQGVYRNARVPVHGGESAWYRKRVKIEGRDRRRAQPQAPVAYPPPLEI